MAKQWVIPDIHGYSQTVISLVTEIIRPERQDALFFLGDYVDRGPDSKGVIDFIRRLMREKYNVVALKGNHEDFMVELYDASLKSKNSWWRNFGNRKQKAWYAMGGKPTLSSFGVHHIQDIPDDYIDWMRNLPCYHELDRFILVHAGMNCKIDDPFSDTRSMLWLRDYEIHPEKIKGKRLVHGHVPVNMELISMAISNPHYKFIDLDNGPYLTGKNGYGNLVALELKSMEMVIQYNMDI
jgi:serine/threonine protein phosphatase 1